MNVANIIEFGSTNANDAALYQGSSLERMAHADRVSTLGELAAGLSHELAQPLLAAHNFTAVAISICGRNTATDSDLVDALTSVHAQVERAVQITKRIQRLIVRRSPSREPFDLHAAVEEVAALLHAEIVDRSANLTFQFSSALPLVYADPILVQQVIGNLLRNAMEGITGCAMEARNIDIETALNPPNHILLSVSDHGSGIGLNEFDTIFTPFHSTKSGGLGLGLSLSRTIIEANDGRLWAENRPSGGAKFSFTLPIAHGEMLWKS